MNGLVRKILKVSQESQHLEEINKMKDSIIADMEKTIKRLREENNAGKRYMTKMQQRKKTTIWCYICVVCIFFISIFILGVDMQIRSDKKLYLPYFYNLVMKKCLCDGKIPCKLWCTYEFVYFGTCVLAKPKEITLEYTFTQ